MGNKLPKNWIETELGEILKLKNGYAFKTKDYREEGIPLIRIGNIQQGEVSTEKSICVENNKAAESFIVEKGDVLVAMSGATTGKYGVFNEDIKVYQNQRVGNLKPLVPSLTSRQFIYYLLGGLQKEIEDKAYGGAQPNISPKLIETIKIGFPPLAEQQRIVAKLDELFNHLEVLKTRLNTIPQLLKNFRQAVLTQAVTGKLTEEWRVGKELDAEGLLKAELLKRKEFWLEMEKDKIEQKGKIFNKTTVLKKYKEPLKPKNLNFDIPSDWVECTWDQLSNWITYGFTKPMPTVEEGISKITVKHVKNNQIDFSTADKTTKEAFDNLNEKDKPKKGDILITKDGATLGRSAPVTTDEIFCIGQSVAVVWLRSTECNQVFLNRIIQSNYIQDRIWEVARGMGMPHLSITDFRSLSIGLPDLKEQTEIVKRVEALFTKADTIETQYQSLKTKIDSLPQAILAKAFKGELVAQLPTDGDAKVLLEEIKKLKTSLRGTKQSVKRKKKTTK